MENVRKIVAVIVGIIVIILLILLARFVGDQIRVRLFNQQPVVKEVQIDTPKVQVQPTNSLITNPNGKKITTRVATVSAIPATGPREDILMVLVGTGVVGLSSLALSKKILYTV